MMSGEPVALVTAAADGIGAATAAAFAAGGYRVVGIDVAEVGGGLVADVTEPAEVERAVTAVVDEFGRIDALANVVGGSRPGKTVVELTIEEWDRLLALNLTSTFLLCRAVIPHMEAAGGGAIVNVSSGAGVRGMTKNPGYVAAKAGVAALTRALALDHGPNGVRVNCVAPGPVLTPLMRRNRTDDEIAWIASQSIVGRVADPAEIARVIVWLCGSDASYLMGQTLEVDGGVVSGV